MTAEIIWQQLYKRVSRKWTGVALLEQTYNFLCFIHNCNTKKMKKSITWMEPVYTGNELILDIMPRVYGNAPSHEVSEW